MPEAISPPLGKDERLAGIMKDEISSSHHLRARIAPSLPFHRPSFILCFASPAPPYEPPKFNLMLHYVQHASRKVDTNHFMEACYGTTSEPGPRRANLSQNRRASGEATRLFGQIVGVEPLRSDSHSPRTPG